MQNVIVLLAIAFVLAMASLVIYTIFIIVGMFIGGIT
jgi:hypothetical protein